jgi:hypothetical protein
MVLVLLPAIICIGASIARKPVATLLFRAVILVRISTKMSMDSEVFKSMIAELYSVIASFTVFVARMGLVPLNTPLTRFTYSKPYFKEWGF